MSRFKGRDKTNLIRAAAGVLLCLALTACATAGDRFRQAWHEKQRAVYELNLRASGLITTPDFHEVEKWTNEDGQFLEIHYLGPKKFRELAPCGVGDRIPPACLVKYGLPGGKIIGYKAYSRGGLLPNGERYYDPSLADELAKRFGDIRKLGYGF